MFAKIADYCRIRKCQSALDARMVLICGLCEAAISVTEAPLAELAEQLTLDQWVLGSSPRGRTK